MGSIWKGSHAHRSRCKAWSLSEHKRSDFAIHFLKLTYKILMQEESSRPTTVGVNQPTARRPTERADGTRRCNEIERWVLEWVLEPMVCTCAFIATLVSAYTCNFVTNDGLQFGPWRYQEPPTSSYREDDKQCVLWQSSDESFLDDRHKIIVSVVQAFTITATVIGGLVWFGYAILKSEGRLRNALIYIEIGSILCALSTLGFLLLFVVCPDDTCTAGFGSIMAPLAVILWIFFVTLLLRGKFNHYGNSNRTTRDSTRTPGHSKPTGPSRNISEQNAEQVANVQPVTSTERDVRVWKDENGKMKKSFTIEYRNSQGTKVAETRIETLKKAGAPLISTGVDENGLNVRTIITEYVDSAGMSVFNKRKELIEESSSQGDECNSVDSDEEKGVEESSSQVDEDNLIEENDIEDE